MQTKAVFLDRDGVINVEKEYLHKWQDFEFLPTVLETCRKINEAGYLIVIITNQSGISRGYYTKDDFDVLTERMLQEFEEQGIKIADVYCCPHHPDFDGDCDCRKPEPGMILQAAKDFDIDLSKSFLAGDKESDIEAGINAGVSKNFLMQTGHEIDVENTKATTVLTALIELLDFL